MDTHLIRALSLCLLLVHLVLGENLTSPCPEVLRYENRTEEGKFYGTISVATEYDLEGVFIRIYLDKKAQLLGNWFATALSNDHKEFQIRNPDYKLEAGPPIQIRFFIEHDPNDVPNIIKISVNGRVICSETKKPHKPDIPLYISSEVSHHSTANFDPVLLEHSHKEEKTTIRPIREKSVENVESRHQFHEVDRNKSKIASKSRSTTKKSIECGTLAQLPTPLISNGQNTIPDPASQTWRVTLDPKIPPGRANHKTIIFVGCPAAAGQYPWHAAIYVSNDLEIKYTCGGTLVSERHVVSAAHCVTKQRTTTVLSKELFIVYFGKHNIIRFGSEVQNRMVDSIDVHPDYDPVNMYNDISVLKLRSPVEITNYVRPACLWEGDSDFNKIVGKNGVVVGWGFNDQGKFTEDLTKAEMPIVSKDHCRFSNREFFNQFLHETNFCVGYRNGTSACNGDSGGGFVLSRPGTSESNVVWQLRGIVSVAVAKESSTGSVVCNPKHYTIFTDAAVLLPWIETKISS